MKKVGYFFMGLIFFGFTSPKNNLVDKNLNNVEKKCEVIKKEEINLEKKLTKKFSDLSIENVCVEEDKIKIVLKNIGEGKITVRDYRNGIVEMKLIADKSNIKRWKLFQIDPQGKLNLKEEVKFNTNCKVDEPITVIVMLRNMLEDGKKGRKIYKVVLKPGKNIFSRNIKTKDFKGECDLRELNTTKRGIHNLENALKKEEIKKAQRMATLEESTPQKAFEKDREFRRRYNEEFTFSQDNKMIGKDSLRMEDTLWGKDTPSYGDWEGLMGYMTEESRSPYGGYNSPYRTLSWRDVWEGLKSFGRGIIWWANNIGFPTPDPYNVEWYGEELREACDMGYWCGVPLKDDENIDMADSLVIDEEELKKEKSSKDNEYINPSKLGYRKHYTPWSPHRESKPQEKDEKTDVDRRPHGYFPVSAEYDKRKKENETPNAVQVNLGSDATKIGQRHMNNAGAETIWRLNTLAVDPDFPSSQAEKMESQQQMK